MLKVQVFGTFTVTVGNLALETRTPKDLSVLAYLIYQDETPVTRGSLARLFWDKDKKNQPLVPEKLSRLLTQTLTSLSAGLGEERWRIARPTSQMVQFETKDAVIDLKELKGAIDIDRPEELLRAACLYRRGPFLADWNDAWIIGARRQIEAGYLDALERAAQLAAAMHDPATAQRCLETR